MVAPSMRWKRVERSAPVRLKRLRQTLGHATSVPGYNAAAVARDRAFVSRYCIGKRRRGSDLQSGRMRGHEDETDGRIRRREHEQQNERHKKTPSPSA
jgi:hypothetical protein